MTEIAVKTQHLPERMDKELCGEWRTATRREGELVEVKVPIVFLSTEVYQHAVVGVRFIFFLDISFVA